MDDQEQPDLSVVSTNIFCKCLSYKKINNLLSEVVNSCMYRSQGFGVAENIWCKSLTDIYSLYLSF